MTGLEPLPRTAWARIDLDAIAANLAAIRRALPAGTRVDPVVKADAYGHGAVPVARTLAAAGADGLCVATFDEALELRAAGLRLPILVLFPIPPEHAPVAARRGIEVSAGDPELLARTLDAVAADRAGRRGGRRLRIHLEIETGLGRGGVLPADAAGALARIRSAPGAAVAGVWSHLATPEDPAVAGRQATRFRETGALLSDARIAVGRRHLASSGGLMAATVPLHDAVRVGLAVYGLLPEGFPVAAGREGAAAALRPAMSLHARPVRVIELPTGSGVGYDATFVTDRPSRIATLPIGYGDGWTRAYSNRAAALVRGSRVPLVGNVAMDAVMADVTDLPGPPVTVDDEFVLLGEQGAERIVAADLARARGSNSWEVVTTISRRVSRLYVAGGRPVATRTLARG
ncbi:MAG: alanine racemase [Chloroflexota bacterium]